jgi:hypothetical protein
MISTNKKLRITEATHIVTLNAPSEYKKSLGKLPKNVTFSDKLSVMSGHIHLFIKNQEELERSIVKVFSSLKPGGLLWIFYPKANSGIPTDLTRDKGWEALNQFEAQWLSLISFNERWTAFLMRNSPPKRENKSSEDYHENVARYTDNKTKTVIIPKELEAQFKLNKKARAFFDSLSFTNKKEYVIWIVSAKREETRQDRIKKTIEKLLIGRPNPSVK